MTYLGKVRKTHRKEDFELCMSKKSLLDSTDKHVYFVIEV